MGTKTKPKSYQIGGRIKEKTKDQVESLSDHLKITKAQFIRRSIKYYIIALSAIKTIGGKLD